MRNQRVYVHHAARRFRIQPFVVVRPVACLNRIEGSFPLPHRQQFRVSNVRLYLIPVIPPAVQSVLCAIVRITCHQLRRQILPKPIFLVVVRPTCLRIRKARHSFQHSTAFLDILTGFLITKRKPIQQSCNVCLILCPQHSFFLVKFRLSLCSRSVSRVKFFLACAVCLCLSLTFVRNCNFSFTLGFNFRHLLLVNANCICRSRCDSLLRAVPTRHKVEIRLVGGCLQALRFGFQPHHLVAQRHHAIQRRLKRVQFFIRRRIALAVNRLKQCVVVRHCVLQLHSDFPDTRVVAGCAVIGFCHNAYTDLDGQIRILRGINFPVRHRRIERFLNLFSDIRPDVAGQLNSVLVFQIDLVEILLNRVLHRNRIRCLKIQFEGIRMSAELLCFCTGRLDSQCQSAADQRYTRRSPAKRAGHDARQHLACRNHFPDARQRRAECRRHQSQTHDCLLCACVQLSNIIRDAANRVRNSIDRRIQILCKLHTGIFESVHRTFQLCRPAGDARLKRCIQCAGCAGHFRQNAVILVRRRCAKHHDGVQAFDAAEQLAQLLRIAFCHRSDFR